MQSLLIMIGNGFHSKPFRLPPSLQDVGTFWVHAYVNLSNYEVFVYVNGLGHANGSMEHAISYELLNPTTSERIMIEGCWDVSHQLIKHVYDLQITNFHKYSSLSRRPAHILIKLWTVGLLLATLWVNTIIGRSLIPCSMMNLWSGLFCSFTISTRSRIASSISKILRVMYPTHNSKTVIIQLIHVIIINWRLIHEN